MTTKRPEDPAEDKPATTDLGRPFRPKETAKAMGLSVCSLYRIERTNPPPLFPRRRKLAPRISVYYEREIDAYIASTTVGGTR